MVGALCDDGIDDDARAASSVIVCVILGVRLQTRRPSDVKHNEWDHDCSR
jgi:hypothetical protein